MARRKARSEEISSDRAGPSRSRVAAEVDDDEDGPGGTAAVWGERLRRVALGLTAALITARVYAPSEPDLQTGAGTGLYWVLAVLATAGLAWASGLIGGRFHFRWSWADLAVVGLMLLVANSSRHAIDRRPALNLAWEWIALGVVYGLARHLPRGRDESSALAGALIAAAVATSAYGLYQAGAEMPQIRAEYQRSPTAFLMKHRELNIAPGTREQYLFEQRLLESNEVYSTFGLANSFAAFLVGPLAMMLAVGLFHLPGRDGPAASVRWAALAVAGLPALLVLVCLILTKSRSAYLGLVVAAAVIGWRGRGRVAPRFYWGAGAAGVVLVLALVAVGLASGRLDREVLTQSSLSMRYRLEYWQGTWLALTRGTGNLLGGWNSRMFWWGVGPGNFRAAYLRYKLPESSEEILDPHNLFLEAWATAGIWALALLLAAVALGAREMFGRSTGGPAESTEGPSDGDRLDGPARRSGHKFGPPDRPPARAAWLIAAAGGGWILVLFLLPLNLFVGGSFPRWLVLGAGWLAAVVLGAPIWRRSTVPALAPAAGFVAVLVALLAGGGIGIPTVALGLWTALALGLNLREDRSCGRAREHVGRVPPLLASFVWAAALGLFLGAAVPYWRAEAAIGQAEDAMRRGGAAGFEQAEFAYQRAIAADHYYARPWIDYAALEWDAWTFRGAKPEDLRWRKVLDLLSEASQPPRGWLSWSLHLRRAQTVRRLLKQIGPSLPPIDVVKYRAEVAREARLAARLYPSSAMLRAQLAAASAEISMFGDAAREAEEALRLDRTTPHGDKKLAPATRKYLQEHLPEWRESAEGRAEAHSE